jgi:membrane dipeptidase
LVGIICPSLDVPFAPAPGSKIHFGDNPFSQRLPETAQLPGCYDDPLGTCHIDAFRGRMATQMRRSEEQDAEALCVRWKRGWKAEMDPTSFDGCPIVDSHLDLAENVTLFGRDMTLPAAQLRAIERRARQQATATLPELMRGGVAVTIATVTPGFRVADVGGDFEPRSALYRTPEEAAAQALKQIALYNAWEREGRVRLVKSRTDLEDHLALWRTDRVTGLVLLMESADPIVRVADLPTWWRQGVRLIGLTFGDTKYGRGVAGGNLPYKPGGLTPDGFQLLEHMAELGFSWDISHLAEEGVWQGLEMGFPRVCASHANARALTPTSRHLSDDLIRALAGRGGVIELVLYNAFLEPRWRQDHSIPVTLEMHLRRQAEYIAGLAGWGAIGIGSDLDGGFGLEECPQEIDPEADLTKIAAVLPPEAREPVLGGNWLNFLRTSLP